MLKSLVKLETNKSCADCKRNKHPRWASWNLGVFVCIRCSGVHRGMGTHISRVKSVDLDSWTDEQTASMVRWGNARANRYYEHKLAEGHVPNESKIENFIRTKYDSKRWVMDGPMPDPSTLGDDGADDDVPLNVVREKAIERAGSRRNRNPGASSTSNQPVIDLFGAIEAPARASTTEPTARSSAAPPKASAAPPRQTKPGDNLLGLDFFGGPQTSQNPRPLSTGPPGGSGRADLKSSILSLYASKPAAPQHSSHSSMGGLEGMQSPPLVSQQNTGNRQQQSQQQPQLGGLGDAFSSLSFGQPQSQPQKSPAFSTLTSPPGNPQQSSSASRPSTLSGGSFFDTKPAPAPKPTSPHPTTAKNESFGNDWGEFSSAASATPLHTTRSAKTAAPAMGNRMGDLFDLSSPQQAPVVPSKQQQSAATSAAPPPPIQAAKYSAFNLSQQPPPPKKQPHTSSTTSTGLTDLSNADAWGSNDAWATPDPPSQPAAQPPSTTRSTFAPAPSVPSSSLDMSGLDSGWGDNSTGKAATSGSGFSVQQDEDFGGWSHSSPVATTSERKPSATGPTSGGFSGTQDDLFGNVWG